MTETVPTSFANPDSALLFSDKNRAARILMSLKFKTLLPDCLLIFSVQQVFFTKKIEYISEVNQIKRFIIFS